MKHCRLKQWTRILLLLGLVLTSVFFMDIGCLIKWGTGFPCPGCGQTRAWLALFQGDVQAAFAFHPLFWLILPLLLLAVFRGEHVFKQKRWNLIFWMSSFLLLFAVYVVRMMTLFPHTPPMTPNRSAPLFRLISYLFFN